MVILYCFTNILKEYYLSIQIELTKRQTIERSYYEIKDWLINFGPD